MTDLDDRDWSDIDEATKDEWKDIDPKVAEAIIWTMYSEGIAREEEADVNSFLIKLLKTRAKNLPEDSTDETDLDDIIRGYQ